MIRKPVVSGQFYPQGEEELKDLIDKFAQKEPSRISAKAIILPHAGYIYSGKVAVATVNKILSKKRIVILGTNHTGIGENFSLWQEGTWEIPLGKIEVDRDLAESILNAGDVIKKDYLAHKFEHSIEVELPILKYFFDEFKIVPIVCQVADLDTYHKAASQIYEGIRKTKEEILLVASTDLSHYEPDATVRKKDRIAIDKIINLDGAGLVKTVIKENISMCGIAPVAVLISCVKQLGARKVQVALYQTSADAGGDPNSVVGYVGIIIK